jgi:hypothetical protein
MRPRWEDLLGNPDVHLDGEAEAVEAIRRWVLGEGERKVLPADQFIWDPADARPNT